MRLAQGNTEQNVTEFLVLLSIMGKSGKEPTLADVMAMLSSMNLKFDDMKGDVKILSEGFARLQDEVKELREDCAFIRQENKDLKAKNERLEKTVTEMDRKVDNLEGRPNGATS